MTELNGNSVDVFRMGSDGRPVDEIRMPANSLTPFGAEFTRGNILGIVETNDTSRRWRWIKPPACHRIAWPTTAPLSGQQSGPQR